MKKVLIILLSTTLLFIPTRPLFAQSPQVSATIPARVTDYPFSLTTADGGTEYGQTAEIRYNITYGSLLSFASPLTIEATWTQGSLSGITDIDVVSYKTGSASPTDTGVKPVIDLVNNTITWTIPSFPADTTEKTISFNLLLKENYTGKNLVPYTVSARIKGFQLTTPYQTLTNYYKYIPRSSTTSESTPTPTLTSVSPTPVNQAHSNSSVTDLSMSSISADNAVIVAYTAIPTGLVLQYGTSRNILNTLIADASRSKTHTFRLQGLTADTIYYYYFSEPGVPNSTSEMYSFKTAKKSTPPSITPDSLIVSSSDTILYTSGSQQALPPLLEIPVNTPYSIRFSLSQIHKLHSLKMYLKNNSVLGLWTTAQSETQTENLQQAVQLQEVEPGIFVARFKSPPQPGTYEAIARVSDTNGNITENKFITIRIIPPLSVTDKNTSQGVEHARVAFYYYNTHTRTYDFISPNSYSIQNPTYTDASGQVSIVLPRGKYKVEVSRLGYETKTITFILGDLQATGLPQISLEPQPFNLMRIIQYYSETTLYFLQSAYIQLLQLTASQRFFDIVTLLASILFLLVMLSTFRAKSRIVWRHIPTLLKYHFLSVVGRNTATHGLRGTVLDAETKVPLTGAHVFLTDGYKRIMASTSTNAEGIFKFTKLPYSSHQLFAIAKGYVESDYKEVLEEKTTDIFIQKNQVKTHVFPAIVPIARAIYSVTFEMLLLLSFVLELIFTVHLGLHQTFPFILISVLSLWMYVAHHSNA